MTECYEFVHSDGHSPALLVFPAGSWEQLPIEVRFSRAWYDGKRGLTRELNATQRQHIERQGYIVVVHDRVGSFEMI
jgi:hypothetical protein